jgi:hypothetical protein
MHFDWVNWWFWFVDLLKEQGIFAGKMDCENNSRMDGTSFRMWAHQKELSFNRVDVMERLGIRSLAKLVSGFHTLRYRSTQGVSQLIHCAGPYYGFLTKNPVFARFCPRLWPRYNNEFIFNRKALIQSIYFLGVKGYRPVLRLETGEKYLGGDNPHTKLPFP